MRVVIIDRCDDDGNLELLAVVEKPVGKSGDGVFLAWYRRNVDEQATKDEMTSDHEKFAGYAWREKEVTEWREI